MRLETFGNLEFGIWNLEFGVWSLELGLGMWELGVLEGWGLEFSAPEFEI